MDKTSELDTLLALPFLQDMAAETRARVVDLFLSLATRESLADGETLLRKDGLGGDTGFLLVAGEVAVEVGDDEILTVAAPTLLGEMYHLNPHAHRTATVAARGSVDVLRFSWTQLYAAAREKLDTQEQFALLGSIEGVVLERFHQETLADLPLLRGLPDHVRLRVCLMLEWMGNRRTLADEETLFGQNTPCGDQGYVLTRGQVALTMAGRTSCSVKAPNVIGVLPDFDPELRWTMAATAKGGAEVQTFSWLELRKTLEQQLPQGEYAAFDNAIRAFTKAYFSH